MTPADAGGGPRRTGLWLAAGVLVVAVAFAVGLAVGRGSAPAANPPRTDGERGPAPARVVEGVPVGYPRTEQGAVTAAATYLQVLGHPALLEPERAREVYPAFVLPEAVDQVLAQSTLPPGVREVTGHRQFAFVVVPAGYRLDRFASSEAVVTVWIVPVVTGPDELAELANAPLREAWAATRVTLRWVEDDWKVAALEDIPGPQPPDLASEIRGFMPFLNQPWPGEGQR